MEAAEPGALLHLGSMAVLVGLVYLNLDKIEEPPKDSSDHRIGTLRDRINLAITRTGSKVSNRRDDGKYYINIYFQNRKAFLLLVVARREECGHYDRWAAFWYHIYSYLRAPGLVFITDGWHRRPAIVLTVGSALAYFTVVGLRVFGIPDYPEWLPKVLFFWYLSTISFVVFCTSMARRLDGLSPVCEKFLGEMEAQRAFQADLESEKQDEVLLDYDVVTRAVLDDMPDDPVDDE